MGFGRLLPSGAHGGLLEVLGFGEFPPRGADTGCCSSQWSKELGAHESILPRSPNVVCFWLWL